MTLASGKKTGRKREASPVDKGKRKAIPSTRKHLAPVGNIENPIKAADGSTGNIIDLTLDSEENIAGLADITVQSLSRDNINGGPPAAKNKDISVTNAERGTDISVELKGKGIANASRCVGKSVSMVIESVGSIPDELLAGGTTCRESPHSPMVGYASTTPSPPLRAIYSLQPSASKPKTDKVTSEDSPEETLRSVVNQDIMNKEPSARRPVLATRAPSSLFSSLRLPEPLPKQRSLSIQITHGPGEQTAKTTTHMVDAEWRNLLDHEARALLIPNGSLQDIGRSGKYTPMLAKILPKDVHVPSRAIPTPLSSQVDPIMSASHQEHSTKGSGFNNGAAPPNTLNNTTYRPPPLPASNGSLAPGPTGQTPKQRDLRLFDHLRSLYRDNLQR